MALSALARLVRQQAFADSNTGVPGPRTSARPTAMKGFARGGLGVYGSRTFKGRDSEAGYKSDIEFQRGPIFRAYLSNLGKI